jgi:hypothetical protein
VLIYDEIPASRAKNENVNSMDSLSQFFPSYFNVSEGHVIIESTSTGH